MGGELQAQVRSVLAGAAQVPSQSLTANTSLESSNPGVVGLDGAGAITVTILAPVTGSEAAGGDDGKVLEFVAQTAHAHVITGPTNCFNGSTHICTFTAAVANYLRLVALGGIWYVTDNINGTLS